MEFEVINGTEAAKIDPRGIPWPENTTAVVARDERGEVKAISTILVLPHIEGTWVAEDSRHGTLPARLVKRVEQLLQDQGGSSVFAFAHDSDPQIKTYLDRFGYQRLPFSVYMKVLKCQ